jgi:hypothetical protein
MADTSYQRNGKLRKAGTPIEFTPDQIREYAKCAKDPIYFIENYVKIISLDHGLITFKPYVYQKKLAQTAIDNRFTIVKLPRQAGKCVINNTLLKLKNKYTNEIKEITIGEFYNENKRSQSQLLPTPDSNVQHLEMPAMHGGQESSRVHNHQQRFMGGVHTLHHEGRGSNITPHPSAQDQELPLSNQKQDQSHTINPGLPTLSQSVDRKFVDSINLDGWQIWTDTGWEDVTTLHKTIPYRKWIVRTQQGKFLECADTHILFDENMNEIFAMDCISGVTKLMTESGPELVSSVMKTDIIVNMFDVTVNSPNHRLFTNGLLSHNTTIMAALLLWYALFNEEFNIGVLAHKEKQAIEIINRIKKAFENLPYWLSHGVAKWNEGSVKFENGSSIISSGTTKDSMRGESLNILYLDEFAIVEANIQEEFMKSVYPVVTAGTKTKIIITSTPKGLNYFYKMWRDSEEGNNSYKRLSIHWSETPGRDEEWKKETIRNTSEEQFQQEFECVFGDTLLEVFDTKTQEIKIISIQALFNSL